MLQICEADRFLDFSVFGETVPVQAYIFKTLSRCRLRLLLLKGEDSVVANHGGHQFWP